jgi:tetratricopeptide (TPR) repeat protein
MLLAVAGVVLARRSQHSLPLLLWPLYGTLLSAVSLGHPRLRLPLLVAAFVYAALPLAHPRLAWQRLRAAAWWRRLLLLAALLALLLLWFARVYLPFAQSQFWLLRARLADNPALLEQASAAMPESYLPYATLGTMRREQGDLPGALAAYEAAHARAPQNARINAHLLSLYRRFGQVAAMREAMASLAAFGWDNNQTYAWAWRNLPPAPVPRLDMSAPAPGVLRGVYPEETDGVYTFRWTHERAEMRLALAGAEKLLLLLRAPQPATPVAVYYNGEQVARLQVGTAWQTFSVPLPASSSSGQGWQHIVLETPTRVQSTAEPYPRGVALGGAWLEP